MSSEDMGTQGTDINSAAGAGTSLPGMSSSDQSGELNPNNRPGLNADSVGVGKDSKLHLGNSGSLNNSRDQQMKAGTEQAEGGSFGNDVADTGNTGGAIPGQVNPPADAI